MNRFLDRNDNAAILLAGILALIVGVGVARFVFTSLLPPMLEDYLDVTFAGILASVNYVGYLAGSIFAVFIKSLNAWPKSILATLLSTIIILPGLTSWSPTIEDSAIE